MHLISFIILNVTSIQLQSILYENRDLDIYRSVASSLVGFKYLSQSGGKFKFNIAFGDCSEVKVLQDEQIGKLQKIASNLDISFTYDFFGYNLGSARGHNTLAAESDVDYLFIMNPDVVTAPSTLTRLVARFSDNSVGLVEAKQLPIEHPKDYDPKTGDTGWATTACALISRNAFELLSGFDENFFFMYCDDLDFSWRLRLNDYRVIFEPSALAFHDKRLSNDGKWLPSSSERYYSAEAALFLAYKWSNFKRVNYLKKSFANNGDQMLLNAISSFDKKISLYPNYATLDKNHYIANFEDKLYAKARFEL
jgi:GT2 family glycosyltransferase